LFGIGLLAAGVAHHGGITSLPHWQCVLGSAAALGGLATAAHWHAEAEKKVPIQCLAGAAIGSALIIVGAAKLTRL